MDLDFLIKLKEDFSFRIQRKSLHSVYFYGFSRHTRKHYNKKEEAVRIDNLPHWHNATSTGYPLLGCSPAEPNSVSPEAQCFFMFQKISDAAMRTCSALTIFCFSMAAAISAPRAR